MAGQNLKSPYNTKFNKTTHHILNRLCLTGVQVCAKMSLEQKHC